MRLMAKMRDFSAFCKLFRFIFVILRPNIGTKDLKWLFMMELHYRLDYSTLSDKQIVEKILATPPDEEAAFFLLHNRYAPLLHNLYKFFTQEETWFDDCVDDLYMHLRGKDCTWNTLARFEWRSSFGYWLKGVAFHRFRDIMPKLIGKSGLVVSIDDDNPEKPKVQIPDGGEDVYERLLRKVMLLEAIRTLKDDDQRFVILKRLEGYKSKEIATMLQERWQKHGIKKYNSEDKLVVPDADYVNVHVQRAKQMLRIIMSN